MQQRMLILALILGLSTSALIHGQAGHGFSYQAIARDGNGNPLAEADISVRFSFHAKTGEGVLIWQEEHDVHTSNLGLFTTVIGGNDAYNQSGEAASFQDIPWADYNHFLKVWIKTDQEYVDMGGAVVKTVPMALHADKAILADTARYSAGNFSVTGEAGNQGEALFEVKRADGMPVFAVYDEGVWVYTDPDAVKGKKGGFAVGGYSATKGVVEEYMRITPDSARIYISPDDAKGKKGGFAVGGYSAAKGITNEFMRITPDSARIYFNQDAAKGKKGGFAVGGYSAAKGAEANFLEVSPSRTHVLL